MPVQISDLTGIIPHLILSAGIIISIVVEISFRKGKSFLPYISILIFALTAAFSILNVYDSYLVFGGTFQSGGIPAFFGFLFNIAALLTVLNSIDYLEKYGCPFGEYYILLQSSILGMMLMAGAKDLFVVFMGLELMSISFYVLAGFNRKKTSSNEAGMKYFLLGAFATGFVVYGMALVFGTSGTTGIQAIISNFGELTQNGLFITGFLLILIGFTFKIGGVPFHMWVPDVYQGSATTVTGLMSTAGKAAAFSVLLILLGASIQNNTTGAFTDYFSVIAVLSMLAGSIIAIAQKNLKRMLAYSSIAHAGYMAIGLASANKAAAAGIIFYLAAYTFMNLGAFGIISIIEDENDGKTDLDSYAGLSGKYPLLAGLMALFMFALAGIPPLAGFFGKYYVFISAIENGMTWLAILGILGSIISVYFYLRVVVYMYFKKSETEISTEVNYPAALSVVISGILVIFFGLFPDTLMNLILSVL